MVFPEEYGGEIMYDNCKRLSICWELYVRVVSLGQQIDCANTCGHIRGYDYGKNSRAKSLVTKSSLV